jgi:AcrR family transcriptional regulator
MSTPEGRVTSPNRSGVVAPKQSRGHQARARLVESCLRLVEDRPFEQISIAEIAAEAGMSVGNFYRRFLSKEAILPDLFAIYEARFAEFAERVRQAPDFADLDLRARVTAVVQSTAELFRANRGLIQSLHLFSRLHPELVPLDNVSRRAQLYESLGQAFEGEGPGDPVLQGRVAAMCLVSVLREQVVYPEQAPAAAVALDDDVLIGQLVEMIVRYVTYP